MLGRIAAAGPAACDLDAASAGAAPRDPRRQLGRLTAAGLVAADGPRLVARIDRIREALEEVAGGGQDASAAVEARVRALFRRGRIVEIPRAPELRLALLRRLAGRFEPARAYREPEVNAVLREAHDEHAALRRHLVDGGLLVHRRRRVVPAGGRQRPGRELRLVIPARARLRLRAVLAGALAAGLTAGIAAPAHALTVGVADNKPDMFADPRFRAAGIRVVRLSVGWDALSSPWQAAELDAWLGAAQAANVEPLVSFGHSRTSRRSLPTPERFLFEFRRFRARYPWVTDFAAWNEANHCGEPTCHRPRLVAAYYRKLRRECPACRILAAEVLDTPNMVHWVKAFRRAAHEEPRCWGIHNYVDANRRRTRGTRRLLRAVKGHVWFTETGGIVARHNAHRITFPESAHHAAVATRFVFRRLVPLSRRVTRVYIYQWNAGPPQSTWDSGLIGPTGRIRPAWRVVERALAAQAARETAQQTGGATPLPG